MAKKPTITSITSGYASTNTLNDNFEALRDAFDNTLSLDGSTPNSMTSDLNLNNNDILNASRILVGGVDYIATALSYKNAAEAAQTAAETAQAAAELVYDNFDDRYLGSKASDPTLDNDGDALLDGALYYDTINTVMKFYDTSTATWYRTTPTTSDQANIDIVAGNTTNINTVAGISSDVTTVAGISSDVTTVAADSTDIGTVATSISNVNTAATNISNINTVAGISSNVTTVAGNTSNINTVATDISNVNTVAGQTTNLQNVTDNLTAIQNAATNATNAATSASNAATSASNASTSETNAASSATAAAASAAAAASSADFFDDVYLGSKASDPSVDNDGDPLNAGDLYFNTTSNTMRVYSGSAWQDAAVDSSGFVQTTGDTLTGNLNFGDNDKAIFGAGSDLQIYHDGADSYVHDAGTGILRLKSNGTKILMETAAGATLAEFINNGNAVLYSNNVERVRTTGTGIDVTGTVTADGLTVDATESYINGRLRLESGANSQDLRFSDTSTTDQNAQLRLSSGSLLVQSQNNAFNSATTRASFASNGDISFYEDTGTTPKFFWDASAESLGIGTTPSAWSTFNALEMPNGVYLGSYTGGTTAGYLGTNNYFNGSNFIYKNSDFATRYQQVDGKHQWFTAPSGTAGNSISFSQAMTLDASGNVGIGTSSPSSFFSGASQLVVGSGSGAQGITIYSANNDNAQIFFADGTTGDEVYRGILRYRHDNDAMTFHTAGVTERMRIDSSGVVRIGGQTGTLKLGNDATYYADIEWEYNNNELAFTANNTANFTFNSNGSERMRIDSSGNLLVGMTSANTNNDGAGIRADGLIHGKRADVVATFNRKTTDGTVVQISKDNTVVGSIGTAFGYMHLGEGVVGLGFRGADNTIYPYSVTGAAARDGAIKLGSGSYRFHSMYLSDGVYLGGTGSANKLDDYEEGEYYVTVTASTSGSYTMRAGYTYYRYVKIGQMVHIQGMVSLSGASSPVGEPQINLPFTVGAGTNYSEWATGSALWWDNSASVYTPKPIALTTGSTAYIQMNAADLAAYDYLVVGFSYYTA